MALPTIILFFLLLISLLLTIVNTIFSFNNKNIPSKEKTGSNFCILVPARDESKVIEDLLISIKNQTHKVNMRDVYVIVETKDDRTVDICKKYNSSVIYRKNILKQRKGYALDDAVKKILLSKKHYDLYFIFDADNILDKDFIKNMMPIYEKGYDLAAGYRNCKNGNESVVAASSALTFSLINTIFNDIKVKQTKNITFSGTGFYIKGSIIESLGSYPFYELTEDYELSLFATLNNYTTYYNTKSVFYDEQPVRYKDTINQRQRWIRGYFDVRRKYFKQIHKKISFKDNNFASKFDAKIGVYPYAITIVALFIYIISLLINLVVKLDIYYLTWLISVFVLIYLVLLLITFLLLIKEGRKINLSIKSKIKTLLYNPIFIISYIPCAILALTKKDIKWSKIEHGKK